MGNTGKAAVLVTVAMLAMSASAGAAEPAVRDCNDMSRGQFENPFESPRSLVAGPLAMVGAGGSPGYFEPRGGQKFPLIVKPGHRVTVAVPRAAADFARLAYGGATHFESADRAITFIACRDAGSPWDRGGRARNFWSGFVLARTPGCVPLRIRADRGAPVRRVIQLGVTSCE